MFWSCWLVVCPPIYLKCNERICMNVLPVVHVCLRPRDNILDFVDLIRITIRIQAPDYDH